MKIDVTLHLTLTVTADVYDFGHPASRFSPASGPQYDIDIEAANEGAVQVARHARGAWDDLRGHRRGPRLMNSGSCHSL